MNKRLLFPLLLFLTPALKAQEVYTDSLGFQYFNMADGDTVYVMKQYFMVFLKTGTNRSHTPEEARQIQTAHLAHLGWLAKEGHAQLIGPFGDDGEVRGIVVMSVPTLEKAKALTEMDPAVKAGRLVVEVHPWWTAKGGTLR